ncbi:hypothetical protein D3C76_1419900 [compost metagenome]
MRNTHRLGRANLQNRAAAYVQPEPRLQDEMFGCAFIHQFTDNIHHLGDKRTGFVGMDVSSPCIAYLQCTLFVARLKGNCHISRITLIFGLQAITDLTIVMKYALFHQDNGCTFLLAYAPLGGLNGLGTGQRTHM